MHIIPLDPHNPQHTAIVAALVLQSTLDYGNLEDDPRLLAWSQQTGRWAVAAASDTGAVLGIACVVALDDQPADGLLWLEVLPAHQGHGVGSALLDWARSVARPVLVIHSTASARKFYEQRAAAGESDLFPWAA